MRESTKKALILPTILKINNGLNGYHHFGWVDINRFQQSLQSFQGIYNLINTLNCFCRRCSTIFLGFYNCI